MKILIAQKFYYRRGGDCIYTIELERLLTKHGHEVAVFSMDYPRNIDTPWSRYFPRDMRPWMALTRPFGSQEVIKKFGKLLDDFRPDIVHLNNIHTQLSPVIAELAHQRGVRVVWTVHDYKLLCPRYDCLRGGKEVCELCFSGDKRPCLAHKCMKGSWAASWIGYREAVKWNRERLEACTDLFVCPSRFMAEKMAQGGFNQEKLEVLHNFIDVEKCRKSDYGKDDYYCYVGRLSHEKGVGTLIEAASQLPYKLKIIGEGPLLEHLKMKNKQLNGNAEFLGFQQWDEIKDIVGRARFTVTPSEWYEVFGLVNTEAQCLGTPVLGAHIGGIPELIDESVNGMTFTSGDADDLKDKIRRMYAAAFDHEAIAREAMRRYNTEAYYAKIMDVYNKRQTS